MGTICILGVDGNPVLKDFVRAHTEYLNGDKISVGGAHGDYAHDGKTIRVFYASHPFRRRLSRLLPHAIYARANSVDERRSRELVDSLAVFFRLNNVDVILAEFGTTGADFAPIAR